MSNDDNSVHIEGRYNIAGQVIAGFFTVVVALIGGWFLLKSVIRSDNNLHADVPPKVNAPAAPQIPQKDPVPPHDKVDSPTFEVLPIRFIDVKPVKYEELLDTEYEGVMALPDKLIEDSSFAIRFKGTSAYPETVDAIGFTIDSLSTHTPKKSTRLINTYIHSEHDIDITLINPRAGDTFASPYGPQEIGSTFEEMDIIRLRLSPDKGSGQYLRIRGRIWIGNKKGRSYSEPVDVVLVDPKWR